MGGFRLLRNHPINSILHHVLYRLHLPPVEPVCRRATSNVFHPILQTRGFCNTGYARKPLDYANIRMLHLTRCFHATGFVSRHFWILYLRRINLYVEYKFPNFLGFYNSRKGDPYKVLRVPQNASKDEIKKAFQTLAKNHHPDVNKNSPLAKRKFQEIREAYEVLQDPKKRAEYHPLKQHSRERKNTTHSRERKNTAHSRAREIFSMESMDDSSMSHLFKYYKRLHDWHPARCAQEPEPFCISGCIAKASNFCLRYRLPTYSYSTPLRSDADFTRRTKGLCQIPINFTTLSPPIGICL